MAFDEKLASRVRDSFKKKGVAASEKRMIGGLCFLVKDKMCVGIANEGLLARVGPDNYATSLKKKGCRPMELGGRTMKNYVLVTHPVLTTDASLDYWVELCLEYNPKAKASKK